MPDAVDPQRPRPVNPFDQADGYSGQGYTAGREIAEGARTADPALPVRVTDQDLPPDNCRRAAIDATTGEVHGSGAGAGGGNPGEDFDDASPSGENYPLTGGEGDDGTPGPLGPRPTQATPLG